MKRKSWVILVILLVMTLPVLGATKVSPNKPKPKAKPAATKVVPIKQVPVEWAAKVNSDIISMDLFNRVTEASKKQIQKEMSTEATEEEALLKQNKRAILEQMIEAVILMQWAEREGIEIQEKSIKTKIQELKKTFPTAQEFHKSLAEQGMSVADLERDIKKQIIVDKLINVRLKAIPVSDEEIQSFYDKNIELYVQKEKLHLKQAFFKDLMMAEEERSKLNARKEFEGEDIGLVEQGQLPIEDDKELFGLKTGAISGIISGEAGYYIFKIEEKLPAKETKIEDVKESIRKFLLKEKARTQYTKDLIEEKASTNIIINDKLKDLF